MNFKLKKLTTFCILLIVIISKIMPVFAFNFSDNQVIKIEKDHECIAVLKMQGKDVLKEVFYIVYKDPETGKKQPAFCVEPEKAGVGTGAGDEYDVTLKLLNDERLWRVLYKGYMGSSYTSWNMECDDDLYYATKTAVHCLADGSTPKTKYEVPNRVGIGQDVLLEEVQRRGTKVLEVAQQLYDYGVNGKEKYAIPTANIKKNGAEQEKLINGVKYLMQNYTVTGNREIDNYKVSIKNFPNGTKILNNLNQETTQMTNISFNIAIPIKEIKSNIEGTIDVLDIKIKSYPVFYANAYSDEYQDYITYADIEENISTNSKLNINAYKSSLRVIKRDKENKQPIEGVTFSAKYTDTNQVIGEFITNKNGEINITNLRQGKIKLIEKATLEEYELDTSEINLELEYNQNKEITIYNNHKKGSLEIIKVDKDDNSHRLEGVEFDLINQNGEVVAHLVTDAKGEAEIENLNIGEYTLKEVKTKEEYKIGAEQKVKIIWNETATLTIENVKKKGQIKVIKVDKENHEIKLQGVEFNLLNENNEKLETLVTDKNGEAISSELPIGKYYIQEVKTDSKYILNDEIIEVHIDDSVISEKIVENEKIKGRIKIIKTSEEKNKILNVEAGSPIEGAKFNIYDSNNKLVEQVITNKNGIAESKELEKGKYTVEEIETGKWYILDNKKYDVEILKNNQIEELEITNKPEDPNLEILKKSKNVVKSNEEIDYEFEISNTGNTALTEFTWYDILPSDYAKITKISTGTFNQDINYSIYYKTNQKEDYLILKKDLNSKQNNYIDLTNIHLEKDEKIIEIKVKFGKVNIGFKNIEKPHIYMKANDSLKNDTIIENHTILEGFNHEYRVTDEDKSTSIVYNIEKIKKLPRTGY